MYRSGIESDPHFVPSWATPKSWRRIEYIVAKASRLYRAIIAEKLPSDETRRYISVDTDDPDCYALGNTEEEAEHSFNTVFGLGRKAALLDRELERCRK